MTKFARKRKNKKRHNVFRALFIMVMIMCLMVLFVNAFQYFIMASPDMDIDIDIDEVALIFYPLSTVTLEQYTEEIFESEPKPEPELTIAEQRLLEIDPDLPMVALTFDDGPVGRTSQILDILEQYNVVATFYVIGEQIERHRDIVLRAHNMGSEIANHTWSHRSLDRISDEDIFAQLYYTNVAIEAVIGVPSASMRAPFGRVNDNIRNISGELGLPIVLWSIDPSDYLNRSPSRIYNDIMSEVQDRDIILLHDVHQRSVYATRYLVPSLINSGFQLVTVSELMYFSNITPEPGNIYRHGRP